MKIAILSDIHGNIYAFEKALNMMSELGTDFYIFSGDICGYYFNSIDVIDKLMDIKEIRCIKGNHDDAFIRFIENDDADLIKKYTCKYGDSIFEFKTKAEKKHIDFLKQLSAMDTFELDGMKFVVFHGGPDDNLIQQVFPDNDFKLIDSIEADVIITGHTHHRLLKKINNKIIINPGSIGQPRDGLMSSFATIDTESLVVEFHDIQYDYTKLIDDVLKKDKQPDYLIDVLLRPYK